jgi:hypothetical protein
MIKKLTVSEKINAVRASALAALGAAPHNHCPTCTRSAGAPFRTYDARGKVVRGCVDAFHTGHLVTPSESARWHHRPEAEAIRRADLASLA